MSKLFICKVSARIVRKDKKATPDGFNGYGKHRLGMFAFYGQFSKYRNKSGIYYLKNKVTGKIYIGSSNDIGSRISKHFSQLRKGNHPNNNMLKDYIAYGEDSFTFGVITYAFENLKSKERDCQLNYDIDILYNLQIQGHYRSEAQITAAKNINKDSHRTPEYREKMRKLKSNKIGRFDRDTKKLLEVFDNSNEACCKYSIAKSTLLGCCNGSKKTAKGYVWHYLDEDNNIILNGKGVIRHKMKI